VTTYIKLVKPALVITSRQLVLLVEETGDNHRLPTGQWFYPGPPVSSTNKTDITEILLKVVLNTIKQTNKHIKWTLAIS
jgi:hypothetical protein